MNVEWSWLSKGIDSGIFVDGKELDASKDIYAVKITKEGAAVHYEKVLLESRKIEDKLYFYPIANSELFKNGHLKQNTGLVIKNTKEGCVKPMCLNTAFLFYT